jgi:hypothetical protein
MSDARPELRAVLNGRRDSASFAAASWSARRATARRKRKKYSVIVFPAQKKE